MVVATNGRCAPVGDGGALEVRQSSGIGHLAGPPHMTLQPARVGGSASSAWRLFGQLGPPVVVVVDDVDRRSGS